MPHIVTAKFKPDWAMLHLLIGTRRGGQYNWHCGVGGEYIKMGVLPDGGTACMQKGYGKRELLC